mmetsp:Transcript_17594/g.38509  ORF Transcript_17594/g.38509 Transcript_17594/m.38509 type:complete len:233 (+) Transcript_17594:173-871(+)|eukprot:CAMPEP_0203790404 /NCGR_PEP_ID=MMETSP0100_2-20121128/4024_1 /ASSEMBLY_ACC=CAM_ASM_000210 /TAXON_ID=96639 /ORGANISM=" , Strain NY0313808BC1" /LENGTH=232 /DNA_ID=CAMNT_0050693535 /DNA_START=20 /DNA_END=718 /DNA_ORIENTATION=-
MSLVIVSDDGDAGQEILASISGASNHEISDGVLTIRTKYYRAKVPVETVNSGDVGRVDVDSVDMVIVCGCKKVVGEFGQDQAIDSRVFVASAGVSCDEGELLEHGFELVTEGDTDRLAEAVDATMWRDMERVEAGGASSGFGDENISKGEERTGRESEDFHVVGKDLVNHDGSVEDLLDENTDLSNGDIDDDGFDLSSMLQQIERVKQMGDGAERRDAAARVALQFADLLDL